ncbi:unannotated protein [freshwater metagenome]|uniref:Unannotated protein n=1 Tax=freshwater metagenome TaxID=449393 RepID=A0A6J6BHT3_9ZZZZ
MPVAGDGAAIRRRRRSIHIHPPKDAPSPTARHSHPIGPPRRKPRACISKSSVTISVNAGRAVSTNAECRADVAAMAASRSNSMFASRASATTRRMRVRGAPVSRAISRISATKSSSPAGSSWWVTPASNVAASRLKSVGVIATSRERPPRVEAHLCSVEFRIQFARNE